MEVADGRASPDPWFCNEMSNVRYYKGLGTSTPKEAKAGGMRAVGGRARNTSKRLSSTK